MRICEIFLSVQGEGKDIGLPTVFIRTVGCNLRCRWCDTKYAYDGGSDWSIDRILDRVAALDCARVSLTGGEPLVQEDAPELVSRLLSSGKEVTVETNGSLPIAGLLALDTDEHLTISLDVKCPSSGMRRKMDLGNISQLRACDQLKFVVKDTRDYRSARRIVRKYPTDAGIVFQPVWGTRASRIIDAVLRDGLQVRVLVQLHKVVWGSDARGK